MRRRIFTLVLWLGCVCVSGAAGPVKVACVGDSITVGVGGNGVSYPALLQKQLGDGYEVRNFGHSATTMQKSNWGNYHSRPEFQAATDWNSDVVVIALGTNDGKQEKLKESGEFERDYREMIAHFRSLSSHPAVFICTPPPVAADGNFKIIPAVVHDYIVPAVRQLAVDEKAGLIDLYRAMESRPELLPDKVHPSAEGYRIIAETVGRAIETKQ